MTKSWSMRALFLLSLSAWTPVGCGGDDDDGAEGEGEGESTLAFCTDGLDNDGDGHVDCYDHDCLPLQEDCAPVPFYDDLEDSTPAVPADFSCLHDNAFPEPPGGDVLVHFYAEDFEEQDRVEGVTIDVFLSNRIEGDPDLTLGPTDAQGLTEEVSVPAGTRVAVRTQPVPDQVRLTVQFDVVTPTAPGDVRALSVSDQTYRVVPASVGVHVDPGKGIVAGQFKDCADHEVAGLIASVEGQEPDIRYFVDRLPAREPAVTTEDGLYVAINVDPGDHDLQLHGRLQEGGDLEVVGQREVQVIADSIDIVDLAPLAE
jgi:hypothetical protein